MLNIHIKSFSFKKGLPKDDSTHGGGFVFDCRWIDNPGRIEAYKLLTGADESVQHFLMNDSEMPLFLEQVKNILRPVITKYQARNFDYLSIHFGCTGGQHRSVFAAIMIARFIHTEFQNVQVHLNHREQSHL